jgi:hypothetical protein
MRLLTALIETRQQGANLESFEESTLDNLSVWVLDSLPLASVKAIN